jgi:hypothetical protein
MIVTLSRQMGAYGEVIAARVVAATGLRLVDREYVYQAALAAGIPDHLLQKLMYERRRSLAANIRDTLGGGSLELSGSPVQAANPLGSIFAPILPQASFSLEEAVRSLGLVIKDIASHGNVLILGQAGQVWLRDYAGACHVQVVAPWEQRIARIAEAQQLSVGEARRKVRSSDQSRADFLLRYHGLNWVDALLYHLVINTGQVPVEVAVPLIINAGQALAAQARS